MRQHSKGTIRIRWTLGLAAVAGLALGCAPGGAPGEEVTGEAEGEISGAWSAGGVDALPLPAYAAGSAERCTTAEDCQFDQQCDNPARGACGHHPCAPGAALLSTCSPCVEKICDEDPSCCTPIYEGACAHDPCTSGTALNPACDPCVAAICAARPGCCSPMCTSGAQCASGACDPTGRCTCTTSAQCPTGSTCSGGKCAPSWGAASCVSQVATLCGKTCPAPGSWTASCASKVGSVCGASCDADPGCAHDKCYTGGKLASSCDPCVAQICALDSTCCTASWSQACVDKVKTVCGEACGLQGDCVARLPGEIDPSCAGPDLTLGVPCGGTVTVCNRGGATAPAGIEIVGYPAGAGEMPSCDPSPGAPACATADPIPPGECVEVSGCAGLADGVELLVNPAGASHADECRCDNNWSVVQSGACAPASCAGSKGSLLLRRPSMFIAFDSSTSMRSSGGTLNDRLATRWIPATTGLKQFLQDPASAGLDVALRFWPDNNPAPCNEWPSCPPAGGGGCAIPLVGPAALTPDAAPADAHEQALLDAINAKVANGDTPMFPALDGATAWAIGRKIAHADEDVSVVLITDGIPTGCNTDGNAIAGLAHSAFDVYGVRVHTVGFGNGDPTLLIKIAAAGGGMSAFMVDGPTLQSSLVASLVAIRGDSVACDAPIPYDGVIDPALISVHAAMSDGAELTLSSVPDAGSCGDGYYIDPANPAVAKLCPTTCAALRAQGTSRVDVETPCL